MMTARSFVVAALGTTTGLASGSALAQSTNAYRFGVDPATSRVSYSLSASIPFGVPNPNPAALPGSTLIGENDSLKPADQRTRTKPSAGLFGGCGTFGATQNDAIAISGTITASGSSATPSSVIPGGSYDLSIRPSSSSVQLRGLSLNLVSSGVISGVARLNNFRYGSFCTINPPTTPCNAPFVVPISTDIGTFSLTGLTVVQTSSVATGTLVANPPLPPNPPSYTFSVTFDATVTPTALFGTTPVGTTPQVLPLTLTGSVVVNSTSATVTSTLVVNASPANSTTPEVLPPAVFQLPILCTGANVVLNLTTLSTTVTSSTSATLDASGPRLACKPDVNNDGVVDVNDIFAFLGQWFARTGSGDYDGDTLYSVNDIFAFLADWFAKPFGC